MSAPKGPASISSLQLPSPSVVIGDVMRDSSGAPAMLSVIAYDADGNRLPGVTPQFVITDSIKFAHFDANGLLTGDSVGAVHVLGQIGNLQTPVATVPITVAPTGIAAVTPVDTFRIPFTTDTTPAVTPVGAVISGANGTFAQGFVVHFALTYAPATKAGKSPAVSIRDLDTVTAVGVTDVSGHVSRSLAVIVPFLADDSLAAGKKVDSAVVEMTASYKGSAIPGSPVHVVVPIVVKLPTP
ncbi:MAG TPA: hypothetical protein VN600_05050 [Gemmatimonadaceae bacterium]|nr:hypothetical protein [Gemmatimonadaceae bacterium]